VNTALKNQTQFFDSIGRDAIHRAMNPQEHPALCVEK